MQAQQFTTTHMQPTFGHKLADAQTALQEAKADTQGGRTVTGVYTNTTAPVAPSAVVLPANVPHQ